MAPDDKHYQDAFAEGEMPAQTDTSEDAAFGITPPTAEELPAAGATEAPAAVTLEDTPAAPAETPAAPAEAPAGEAAATPAAEDVDAQRERSWEGRLRAREAELAQRAAELEAREAALKGSAETPPAAAEQTDLNPEAAAETAVANTEALADDAEPEDVAAAVAQMTEDFGPEFVGAIKKIAMHFGGKSAGDSIGGVNKSIEDLVAQIKDNNVRNHFESILDRHDDFFDVYQSPAFAAWRDGLSDDDKANVLRVEQSGSAREVSRMLDTFKKAQAAGAAQADRRAPDELKPDNATENAGVEETDPWEAAADAEGIRSHGLRLPADAALANDDYLKAFNEA